MNRKIKLLCLFIGVVMLGLLLYFLGRYWEKRRENPEPRGSYTLETKDTSSVVVDGVSYRKKDRLTTVLLMGIDRSSEAESGSSLRRGGQADFLQVLVIDPNARRLTRLSIDRDTMTPVEVLGVLGNRSGVRTMQVSLSHGFGDGKEQSCQLTLEAVSNLLMNVPIQFYAAMDLDGIETLNESVGGVTVRISDDLSAFDPAMVPGATVTLHGKQAEAFVRSRMTVGSGTNEERMQRQSVYMRAFYDAFAARLSADKNFSGILYDALRPYMITDLSWGRIINTAWEIRDYEKAELTVAGEHRIGQDGFMQFYPDETMLQKTVLTLFYDRY